MKYTSRCEYKVWTGSYITPQRQCYRQKGHGENGRYCKQHAKLVEKRQKLHGESDG